MPSKTKDPIQAMMDEAVASVERIERERKGEESPEITIETESPTGEGVPLAPSEGTGIELAQMREQLLRMAADFDNYRKRVRRDQDELRKFSSENLLRDILPIVDNLERALSHAVNNDDPVIAGVRMVLKQFNDTLQGAGVREFPSMGKPFDPERHEAVGQEFSADVAPGTVLHEMQRGYTLHERLLRPARVVVASSNRPTN